jgi:hypothetical protein
MKKLNLPENTERNYLKINSKKKQNLFKYTSLNIDHRQYGNVF